jgi:hypothetical protein
MNIQYVDERIFWSMTWGSCICWFGFPEVTYECEIDNIYVVKKGNNSGITDWFPMYAGKTKTLYVPDHHACAFLTYNTKLGKLYYEN